MKLDVRQKVLSMVKKKLSFFAHACRVNGLVRKIATGIRLGRRRRKTKTGVHWRYQGVDEDNLASGDQICRGQVYVEKNHSRSHKSRPSNVDQDGRMNERYSTRPENQQNSHIFNIPYAYAIDLYRSVYLCSLSTAYHVVDFEDDRCLF